ncbi:hypothetical protein IDJ76_13720 [Mucilaginibacter sp. ZB1P21]|uniref:Uncharacterized protein n=1 Tax=Mucilaginibacter glaciei TaxID=2772109 RepID=A0A926NT73_9SPHI|nr:hypothetical protein [Mucilaginibacter glaciei]
MFYYSAQVTDGQNNASQRVIARNEVIPSEVFLIGKVGTFINVSPLIAADGYFFCLDTKEAKDQVSRKAFLPHKAFALQTGQNHGAATFALTLFPPLQQNPLIPLSFSARPTRSTRYHPKLFCLTKRNDKA